MLQVKGRETSRPFVVEGMTVAEKITVEWIRELIEKDEIWRFYKHPEWIALKEQILKENHYECRICKNSGIITRYDTDKDGNKVLLSTVHHVQWLKKYPELALSRTYEWNGKEYPNLIPVCKACHNKCHKEKGFKNKNKRFWTEERW